MELSAGEAECHEAWLRPYQSICAGSRQRLQQLPDSQRREAAERLALQMMEAFGLDDADDSDDSDS